MTRLLNRAAWIESVRLLATGVFPNQDMGRGVYQITSEGEVLEDSLVFRSAPTFSAPPVAVLRNDTTPEGWRIARILAADSVAANIAEFGYDTKGIAIDSVTPDKRWAHTIFGIAPGGRSRAGWLPVSDSSRVQWWPDLFMLYGNLSVDSTLRIFPHRGAPGPGERVPWPSYDVRSDTIDGEWMRVTIRVPEVFCADKVDAPQTYIRWIRWRDARGRPTVFYWTRGC